MTEKGRLTISKVTTNNKLDSEHISIELTDDGFKMLFEVKMSLADFAKAITVAPPIPCDYKVWDRTEV